MSRNKELKKKYLQMKPEMGLFVVKNKLTDRCYIEATKDLKSSINRAKFQLDLGKFPISELQKDYNEKGANNFSAEVLDTLEYDNNKEIIDYSKDLEILKQIWENKMSQKGVLIYKK